MSPAPLDPGPSAWALRDLIYQRLAATGRCPRVRDLSGERGVSVAEIERLLGLLAGVCVLALDSRGEVWMAHPFSAVPTSFEVAVGDRSYHANCAWDAIAIPMLLGEDGGGTYPCPASGRPIPLRVEDGRLRPVDGVMRFPVPARRFWDDIGFT